MRIYVIDSKLVPYFDLRRDKNEWYWTPKEKFKINYENVNEEELEQIHEPSSGSCGLCGFRAITYDDDILEQMLTNHRCHGLSMNAAFVLIIIAICITTIIYELLQK